MPSFDDQREHAWPAKVKWNAYWIRKAGIAHNFTVQFNAVVAQYGSQQLAESATRVQIDSLLVLFDAHAKECFARLRAVSAV